MDDLYLKMWALVERLAVKTAEGRLVWESTSGKGVFQTSLPKYTVRISEEPNRHTEGMDYVMSIHDSSGSNIERVSDVDLAPTAGAKGEDAFSVMRGLYKEAKRAALGVDKAVDEIITALDEDFPF